MATKNLWNKVLNPTQSRTLGHLATVSPKFHVTSIKKRTSRMATREKLQIVPKKVVKRNANGMTIAIKFPAPDSEEESKEMVDIPVSHVCWDAAGKVVVENLPPHRMPKRLASFTLSESDSKFCECEDQNEALKNSTFYKNCKCKCMHKHHSHCSTCNGITQIG